MICIPKDKHFWRCIFYEQNRKKKQKVDEDLIAENHRLRMKIEYLKKLDALVQKRLKRKRKSSNSQ